MNQITPLINTLKQQLKAQGKTYNDVASVLQLSEASVKRLFAERNFTLQRLESICQMLHLSLGELIQLMQAEEQRIQHLSEHQEQEIADDPRLLLIVVCAINGYQLPDILEQYSLEETECIGRLAHLDRLGLIELLPGNRIRLRIAPNFRWRPDGPIQRFFQRHVATEFFQSAFRQEQEQLLVLNGLLSPAGNARWQQRLQQLVSEFNELCRSEAHLPLAQRTGTTSVLAVRQWRYALFEALAHPPAECQEKTQQP